MDSPKDCTTNRRAERRAAIIEAAAPLFANEGYADCEMEKVAAELGIGKGTLYLYFASKEELFYACVDSGMKQMQMAVRTAASSEPEPFKRISLGIRAYLEFFERHPEHVELLIQERANFKNRKQPTYFEYREANRVPWRELYTQLIQQGRLRADLPVERIVDTIGNLLYGTMFTNHFIGRTTSPGEQHHWLLNIILLGILSDEERASEMTARASDSSTND